MNDNTFEQLVEQRKKLADNYPSLRDQFAMAALSGLISGNVTSQMAESYAISAYHLADAMLKVRGK